MTTHAAPAGETIGSLKDQWKLVLTANRDQRLACLDRRVLMEVIQKFYKVKGSGQAASRYLTKALGAGRRHILNSLRKLLALGYLEETRKGQGTRPTEYRPNFELASGTLQVSATATDASGTLQVSATATDASGTLQGSTGGTLQGSAETRSGALKGTESYLQGRLIDRPIVSSTSHEEGTRGVASPPPLGAPAGAVAGTARDPAAESFKELWTAYAFKQDLKKAKAAYQKLNPDPRLHTELVAAANAWASAYNDNGTESKWRKRLHTWISEEGWLADPPLPYESPTAAASVPTRGSKKKSPAADKRNPTPAPNSKARTKPSRPTDDLGRAPRSTLDDAEKSRRLKAWGKENGIDIGDSKSRSPACSDAQLYDAIKKDPWSGFPLLP